MTYLVCYDIDVDSDKLRKKISDRLLAEGLQRIQYSVFLGPWNEDRLEQFKHWVEGLLLKYEASMSSVIVINLSNIGLEKFHVLGSKDLDLKDILGLEHTLFI